MKRVFVVEIRGQRETYEFDTRADAEAYAITATAWVGGQYRITRAFKEVTA
jgi:hypothetical protein